MQKLLQPTACTTACLLVILSFGLTPAAATESDSERVDTLPPYVVVATRTPLGLNRVSPSVSLISEAEMAFWQDRSVTDALRREPGMPIIPSGTGGSLTSLFTRGTNSNHTAFLLDGRRLNPGFSNQFGIDVLSTSNLSSIEIQRGASSLNYGSNGIGGSVALRSRSGLDVSAPELGIETEIGSNESYRSAFDLAFSEGALGFSAEGSWSRTENERANDGFEKQSVTTRVDYRLVKDLSFELIAQYLNGEKEVPGSTASPSAEQVNETIAWLLSPGLRYATDAVSVHFFYSRSGHELVDIQPGERNSIELDSDELDLQLDYTLTESALLTFGAVYRRDKASDNNVAFFGPAIPFNETYAQVGGFAQLVWQPLSAAELRGGLRYDDYSEFGDEWTWSSEAIYNFSEIGLSLFVKYATSFVPPRTSDIAFDSDPITDPGPETSESYEFGVRQELREGKLVAEAVFFRNNIEDLITFNFTDVGFSGFDIANINEAMTEGVELSVQYGPTDKLDLGLGYTYLTAVDEQSDERLLRRPRHTLQLSAGYQFTESIRAGIFGTGYFDREDLQIASPFARIDHEDSFVVDLVVNWKINQHWSLYA